MKKEKRMFFSCVVLFLLTILTIYVVGGTYARYASELTGTSQARVAKWAWTINSTDLTKEMKTFDLNLFDTVLDTDATSAETDVKIGEGKNIIAPGTSGKFAISVQNKSEVTAQYSYKLEATNTSNIPIEYSLDGATGWTKDISTLSLKDAKTLAVGSEASDATIYWRWVIGDDSTNEADTALGFDGTATVTVKATLTFTQVD